MINKEEQFERAFRDIMSGASGGFIATWSLNGKSDFFIVIMGVVLIVLVGSLYVGLQRINKMSESLEYKNADIIVTESSKTGVKYEITEGTKTKDNRKAS
ncbi:hypothetical protein ACFR9U_04190 [Halorientalis brevis]|uniref:Holin n=1 Tax=Halorientalis brevis TaxID=1126241 RepID=A0ABD6C7H2_9EURY|nr:hypothetical protein [Halorientalis brevis]